MPKILFRLSNSLNGLKDFRQLIINNLTLKKIKFYNSFNSH